MRDGIQQAYRVMRAEARRARWSWHRASAWARVQPEFCIIGCQRGGTTSLYRYLAQHPCILPAMRKEIHFFDNDKHYCEGRSWYQAHFPTRIEMALHHYCYRHPVTTGEATPYYIFHPKAPSRIRAMFPQIKLLALLRNPVDRAYSHYQHSVRKGYEHLSFVEAINREMTWLETGSTVDMWAPFPDAYSHQHLSYLSRGLYAEQLKRWLYLFPTEQLLVLSSESMFADAPRVLQQIFDFLELPDIAVHDLAASNVGSYPIMSSDMRRRLVEFFAPHNESLYQLIGEDFGWEKL